MPNDTTKLCGVVFFVYVCIVIFDMMVSNNVFKVLFNLNFKVMARNFNVYLFTEFRTDSNGEDPNPVVHYFLADPKDKDYLFAVEPDYFEAVSNFFRASHISIVDVTDDLI